MATLTAAQLEALKAKRDALQEAYDTLISGAASAEVRYGEMGERYHQADAAKLEKRIEQLNTQIDAAENGGRRSRGIVVGW